MKSKQTTKKQRTKTKSVKDKKETKEVEALINTATGIYIKKEKLKLKPEQYADEYDWVNRDYREESRKWKSHYMLYVTLLGLLAIVLLVGLTML